MNLWLIPILPFLGFLINGLFGRRIPKALVNVFAVGSVLLSFLWVVKTAARPEPHRNAHTSSTTSPGFKAARLNIGVDFAVDRLTAVMLMVVTGVGLLIHIYADRLHGARGRLLPLLRLPEPVHVLHAGAGAGAEFLLLFVGWEGVGLCSYLLIGFYFLEKFATNAGNKAFIVNRIGDFGFSLAMFLIVSQFGSLDFGTVFAQAASACRSKPASAFYAICLLLLVGARGKSAQIPLYVWLPDAMAGPTPVSALIHAATMVTAGVYMTARSAALFIACAHRDGHGRGHRHGDRVLRGDHRPGADRHQEGLRVLHRFAARLHVPGRRRRAHSRPASST